MKTSLIIATRNQGKIKEFRELLSEFNINILSQPDFIQINENGNTFAENARIKALEVSGITGEYSLADDSGLCVDSLNGAPGIYSSRYASTDSERISKLLNELKNFENRKARFNAAICIAKKGKVILEVEGKCEGLITYLPRGSNGFGYDPIFEVLETGLTFAEMESEKKKTYGHRGIAFKLLKPGLNKLFEIG
ncbi:RdgB/HAM1 family non-canonical purine NTP pyrophosphatase [Prochlorococcus sp. MIT 1223]|uniref:RdgB/HAM1 family non-canonical purine NTP pyrophosphatase n=1 Tax=Prochlorococcus sp. MIT 1223 TaxID=3096217 RepID=UPI002A75DA65|nr:RdgB/HAM1 family non-canonical purine NTP pyrophosphatase [Prochlorococcus sp. MIT 1223]